MVKAKTFQVLKKDKIGQCLHFLLLELIQKREWNVQFSKVHNIYWTFHCTTVRQY